MLKVEIEKKFKIKEIAMQRTRNKLDTINK
jgi:hypothetical protein